jgi:two-component system CheB/CheR fusion protein
MADSPNHIIAIGASAGGMEEINAFFDHTPLDGVCYVIIQHLSPDFKSRMVELLSKHSKLQVLEAEDNMVVSSNCVYLIPHDKFMTIDHHTLFLTDKEKVKGPHLTINTFFNSLAADYGNKAIGVILSGLGSDGTEGIVSIKKAGGMIIVRNPENTEFSGMPSHAIASGMADFILEPEAMPQVIEDYLKDEEMSALLLDNDDDEKYFTGIVKLINEHSPLDFSDYKQTTILRRIKRRAVYKNFSSLEKYFEYLKNDSEEVVILANEFLISVTSFFRDKEAFEKLEQSIIPDIINKLAPGEELKIWVAGCATGEEAYSIGMLICEHLGPDHANTVVKIFATDIDVAALAYAGKGVYNADIKNAVSAERLEKFFYKDGDKYRVKPEIRKMVIFAQHDLVKNPPYCNMSLICCRNLLIYMTQPLQKKIYLMLLFGLKMNGYLFLGRSENPLSIISSLSVIDKKWKIYRNIETKRILRFDAFSLPSLQGSKFVIPSSLKMDGIEKSMSNLDEAVNSELIDELDQLVVCVDENNHVVKSYGDTTKYLLQKNFFSDLTELLPKQLAIAFSSVKKDALITGKKSTVRGINAGNEEGTKKTIISVTPMQVKKGDQKLLMVSFSKDADATEVKDLPVFDEALYYNEYTHNIEKELKELKDKLHFANLKIDDSNENMQSFNEELVSANEEMQSTNEEMQSVNEELHTINAEYQVKNKELAEINDDLNNYFRSNVNGQLFVDNDLQLVKFSPGAVKQINLLPTDIGRPISNISTNIKFETILDDIKKVIADGDVITKEIETSNGKWYQIMTMPYIQEIDNVRKGAIITFNDITELKKAEYELGKRNLSLLRINADLDNFVHTAAHDLLAPLGNIQMSIDVMNKIKNVDPHLSHYLDIIYSSVHKFRGLVSDISNISKMENDMIATEMVELDEIINNVEWSLQERIHAAGAVINRDLQIDKIRFSKKNLRSILYNLVSNSIKFKSKEPLIININTVKEGESVILSVQDNGIGIPKAQLANIFKMYTRLHSEIDGQGIGLCLAKKIVDAAGGNIIVESEPGTGSKFMIYLNAEPVLVGDPVLS